jgi:tetratricopeptide (TPR) repeat protein
LPGRVHEEIRRTTRPENQKQALDRIARAIELLERDDARGAVSEAQKAKRFAPRSGAVREVLGIARYRLGSFEEALADLKAYKRITGRVDQNHLIADCLRAIGRPQEAVSLAEEELAGVASRDAKAEAVVVAASALADSGRYSEALAFLRRARTEADVARPSTLRLWYVKGDILARAGRREDALREFRRIMRYDPTAFDVAERVAALG